jgi:hypothetical protein
MRYSGSVTIWSKSLERLDLVVTAVGMRVLIKGELSRPSG